MLDSSYYVDGSEDPRGVMLEPAETLHDILILSSRDYGGRGRGESEDTECDCCHLSQGSADSFLDGVPEEMAGIDVPGFSICNQTWRPISDSFPLPQLPT